MNTIFLLELWLDSPATRSYKVHGERVKGLKDGLYESDVAIWEYSDKMINGKL